MTVTMIFTSWETIQRKGGIANLAWTKGCNECSEKSYYESFEGAGDVDFGRRMYKWRG